MSFTKLLIATLLSLSTVYASEEAEASEALVPKVTLCTGPNFTGTCLDIPVLASTCVNFDGTRTILNKELTSAKIPKGIACNFFEYYGCTGANTSTANDTAAATWGDWTNFTLTDTQTSRNFGDVPSSMICGPI